VKNAGLNTEYDVDVQLEIAKEVLGDTWTQEESTEWRQSNSANAGGTAPEAYLPYSYITGDYAWFMSPTVDTSGLSSLTLYFRSMINNYAGGYNCYVKSRSSPSDPWTDITPWANPITASVPAERYSIDITADIGTKTQVMFEFDGYYFNLNYWYLDDFECGSYSTDFAGTFPPQGPSTYVPEYDQTATIPVIYPDETIELAFPLWEPADLYVEENVNIPYVVEATNLFADENINNDYKSKKATLHYGWLNDVKVNEITSPVSSDAQSQVPEVIIENVGQLDQFADVNMVISKRQYGAQWQVYNPNGGNTWIRSTTGQRTGTGCAYCVYEYTAEPNDDWLATYGATVAPGGVFSFWVKGYVYNDDTYKVYMSTTGNTIDDFLAGTELYSGIAPSTYTLQSFDMSSYEGQTLYFGIFYNGNYAWYIWVDDVTLPDGSFEGFEGTIFPPVEVTLVPEYDETVTVSIAAGETLAVSLPEWFPVDLPVLMNIDYQADVEVTLGGFVQTDSYGFEDWVPPSGTMWPYGWTQEGVNEWKEYLYQPYGTTWTPPCAQLSWSSITGDYATFVSPAVDTTGEGTLILSFDSFIDDYSGGYYCTVETRADASDPWTARSFWTNPIAGDVGPAFYTMDISDDIGPATQVMFVFSGPYFNLDYWYLDNIALGSAYWDFTPATIPGYFGEWTVINYGDPDQWFGVDAGVLPTCTPPEGTYMAEYNSWNLISGNAADLLHDTPTDFTTSTIMKFQMMHGSYAADDVIYPLLSADGVNWWYDGTAFYQNDGTTGWKDETMDYSLLINYLGGPGYYYIGFEAISDYGYNMFIDDIRIGSLGEVDDGNPADNVLSKVFTLSYIHDAGVVAITKWPQGDEARDIIWDNYGDDGSGNGLSSQFAADYPFQSQCADDFMFEDTAMDITSVHWWGIFWNGVSGAYPNPIEFNVIFYADDGDMPTGAGMEDPTSTALAVYNFPAVTGVEYGTDKYEYDAPLVPAFVAQPNEKYWIAVQAVFPFSGNGQWGFATNGANPEQLSGPVQGFPLLGTAYWTPTIYGDHAFQLSGGEHGGGGGNPEPGTYEIAGVIQNLGLTYTEVDIPVNAQVTNDTGVVVYDETIIVAGPLAPGALAEVAFPDITIPWEPEAEGDYKLTMMTMLTNDEVPGNDKKTQSWIIQIPDTEPPVTEATIAGTMGQDDWYVSSVTVTLTATDYKWPEGVDYTMYKVDDGEWTLYETPFDVDTDGEHTVYFYSVDKAVPPNTEEEQSVSFKIDKTAPVINTFTATAQNALKTKWLLEADATDAPSGIVKVEFYADDALVGTVTAEPYEFLVESKISTAQCIVYDAAGNSKMSDVVTSFDYGNQQQSYNPVQLLQQKLI
jgi:hypothetical protein